MSEVAERLLKRKTRIAEAMYGENYTPEVLDAGEQAIAQEITEILKLMDEMSERLAKVVRGL